MFFIALTSWNDYSVLTNKDKTEVFIGHFGVLEKKIGFFAFIDQNPKIFKF